MTLFIVISLLFGMALGQRFKVLVLVPAIALTLVLTIGTGIGHADALGAIVAMAVATIASLQVGYLSGTGIRHLVVAARASRLRGTAFPG
jgi:hypothetical protein